nr:MAG: RNA-dependent RNA polymerase [brine shrimp phasma-like virus 1]
MTTTLNTNVWTNKLKQRIGYDSGESIYSKDDARGVLDEVAELMAKTTETMVSRALGMPDDDYGIDTSIGKYCIDVLNDLYAKVEGREISDNSINKTPDLIFHDIPTTSLYLIDVTASSDPATASNAKLTKYQPVANDLMEVYRGLRVTVIPVVIRKERTDFLTAPIRDIRTAISQTPLARMLVSDNELAEIVTAQVQNYNLLHNFKMDFRHKLPEDILEEVDRDLIDTSFEGLREAVGIRTDEWKKYIRKEDLPDVEILDKVLCMMEEGGLDSLIETDKCDVDTCRIRSDNKRMEHQDVLDKAKNSFHILFKIDEQIIERTKTALFDMDVINEWKDDLAKSRSPGPLLDLLPSDEDMQLISEQLRLPPKDRKIKGALFYQKSKACDVWMSTHMKGKKKPERMASLSPEEVVTQNKNFTEFLDFVSMKSSDKNVIKLKNSVDSLAPKGFGSLNEEELMPPEHVEFERLVQTALLRDTEAITNSWGANYAEYLQKVLRTFSLRSETNKLKDMNLFVNAGHSENCVIFLGGGAPVTASGNQTPQVPFLSVIRINPEEIEKYKLAFPKSLVQMGFRYAYLYTKPQRLDSTKLYRLMGALPSVLIPSQVMAPNRSKKQKAMVANIMSMLRCELKQQTSLIFEGMKYYMNMAMSEFSRLEEMLTTTFAAIKIETPFQCYVKTLCESWIKDVLEHKRRDRGVQAFTEYITISATRGAPSSGARQVFVPSFFPDRILLPYKMSVVESQALNSVRQKQLFGEQSKAQLCSNLCIYETELDRVESAYGQQTRLWNFDHTRGGQVVPELIAKSVRDMNKKLNIKPQQIIRGVNKSAVFSSIVENASLRGSVCNEKEFSEGKVYSTSISEALKAIERFGEKTTVVDMARKIMDEPRMLCTVASKEQRGGNRLISSVQLVHKSALACIEQPYRCKSEQQHANLIRPCDKAEQLQLSTERLYDITKAKSAERKLRIATISYDQKKYSEKDVLVKFLIHVANDRTFPADLKDMLVEVIRSLRNRVMVVKVKEESFLAHMDSLVATGVVDSDVRNRITVKPYGNQRLVCIPLSQGWPQGMLNYMSSDVHLSAAYKFTDILSLFDDACNLRLNLGKYQPRSTFLRAYKAYEDSVAQVNNQTVVSNTESARLVDDITGLNWEDIVKEDTQLVQDIASELLMEKEMLLEAARELFIQNHVEKYMLDGLVSVFAVEPGVHSDDGINKISASGSDEFFLHCAKMQQTLFTMYALNWNMKKSYMSYHFGEMVSNYSAGTSVYVPGIKQYVGMYENFTLTNPALDIMSMTSLVSTSLAGGMKLPTALLVKRLAIHGFWEAYSCGPGMKLCATRQRVPLNPLAIPLSMLGTPNVSLIQMATNMTGDHDSNVFEWAKASLAVRTHDNDFMSDVSNICRIFKHTSVLATEMDSLIGLGSTISRTGGVIIRPPKITKVERFMELAEAYSRPHRRPTQKFYKPKGNPAILVADRCTDMMTMSYRIAADSMSRKRFRRMERERLIVSSKVFRIAGTEWLTYTELWDYLMSLPSDPQVIYDMSYYDLRQSVLEIKSAIKTIDFTSTPIVERDTSREVANRFDFTKSMTIRNRPEVVLLYMMEPELFFTEKFTGALFDLSAQIDMDVTRLLAEPSLCLLWGKFQESDDPVIKSSIAEQMHAYLNFDVSIKRKYYGQQIRRDTIGEFFIEMLCTKIEEGRRYTYRRTGFTQSQTAVMLVDVVKDILKLSAECGVDPKQAQIDLSKVTGENKISSLVEVLEPVVLSRWAEKSTKVMSSAMYLYLTGNSSNIMEQSAHNVNLMNTVDYTSCAMGEINDVILQKQSLFLNSPVTYELRQSSKKQVNRDGRRRTVYSGPSVVSYVSSGTLHRLVFDSTDTIRKIQVAGAPSISTLHHVLNIVTSSMSSRRLDTSEGAWLRFIKRSACTSKSGYWHLDDKRKFIDPNLISEGVDTRQIETMFQPDHGSKCLIVKQNHAITIGSPTVNDRIQIPLEIIPRSVVSTTGNYEVLALVESVAYDPIRCKVVATRVTKGPKVELARRPQSVSKYLAAGALHSLPSSSKLNLQLLKDIGLERDYFDEDYSTLPKNLATISMAKLLVAPDGHSYLENKLRTMILAIDRMFQSKALFVPKPGAIPDQAEEMAPAVIFDQIPDTLDYEGDYYSEDDEEFEDVVELDIDEKGSLSISEHQSFDATTGSRSVVMDLDLFLRTKLCKLRFNLADVAVLMLSSSSKMVKEQWRKLLGGKLFDRISFPATYDIERAIVNFGYEDMFLTELLLSVSLTDGISWSTDSPIGGVNLASSNVVPLSINNIMAEADLRQFKTEVSSFKRSTTNFYNKEMYKSLNVLVDSFISAGFENATITDSDDEMSYL